MGFKTIIKYIDEETGLEVIIPKYELNMWELKTMSKTTIKKKH